MRIWQLCVAGTYFLLFLHLVLSEICRCTGPCHLDKCVCANSTGSYEITCSTCDGRKRLTDYNGVLLSDDFDAYINRGYDNLSSCSFLIESPKNTTIRLYLDQFMTECNWDFVHFHDGLSPYDQTIGVYGGLLVNDEFQLLKQDKEIVSTSNFLYIVFRPDEFVHHDGFRIYYSVDGCPQDCNGHGQCSSGICKCDSGWQGVGCDTKSCDCQNGGQCRNETVCDCPAGFQGDNCEIDTLSNWWSYHRSKSWTPGGKASFGGALVGDHYWVFGGYSLDGPKSNVKMAKYDLLTQTWTKETESGPIDRDGHTLTAYKDNLIMFGGQINYQITDELWKYDITSSQWHQLNPQQARISSMGHCAVLVNSTIYYIGGIDSKGVVIIDIQTYDVEKNVWNVISHRQITRNFYDDDSWTRRYFEDGRIYHGRYAPSCVLNPVTDRIAVFGGLNTTRIMGLSKKYWLQSEAETIKESTFVEYDMYLQHWGNLYRADVNTVPYVYLAAVGLVGKSLVILGGTHLSKGTSQCHNDSPYVLDLETGEGRRLKSFEKLKHVGPLRMGHDAFTYNNSVYFFGGYNGKLHDDFIVYHFGDCGRVKCYGECLSGDGFDRRCHACETRADCVWDQHYPDTCARKELVNTTGFDHLFKCRNVPNSKPSRIQCSEYQLCEHCKGECVWLAREKRCSVNIEYAGEEDDCSVPRPCSSANTCSKCLEQVSDRACMWCQLDKLYPDGKREGQCLDVSTYLARYPYGQCLKWTMSYSTPKCPAESCSAHRNCSLCQAQPECGWCDDGSGTGTGSCFSGTFLGAHSHPDNVCPDKSWFYDTCPLCQCNGHSNCTDNVHCDQCQGNTQGSNCDTCMDGFYGDATNKGLCKPCHCSSLSEPHCNNISGRCTCNTVGVGGTGCDTCLKGYEGDPRNDGGTCFLPLVIGSVRRSVDKRKLSLVMKLNASISEDVTIEITANSYDTNETEFYLDANMVYLGKEANKIYSTRKTIMNSWSSTFKKSKYDWDSRPAELRLYLEFLHHKLGDQRTLIIKAQQANNQIDLKQFFIIFASCIVILLLIFLLAWTANLRYSQYRTQRNLEIQLQERALRPFTTHKVLFKNQNTPTPGRIFEVRPLGIEPLADEKYGIGSYLLTLPGPKDVNLAIVSSSFVSSLSFGKVISNPNLHFEVQA
ncbi:hypothetical protein ACHWQZ_G008527 [Mnemiopsis leidyi]